MLLLLWYTPPSVAHVPVIQQPLVTFAPIAYDDDSELLALWWEFINPGDHGSEDA